MSKRTFRGLPKILKINEVDFKNLRLSVLFSNGENRILDFNSILNDNWHVVPSDPEYLLLDPKAFKKVKLNNNTLMWENVVLKMTGEDGQLKATAFDVGADVLYALSVLDEKRNHSIGELFRKWRMDAKLTQDEVALKSGTSRTYITKLENGSQDIELDTLYRIVEGGLNKKLVISVK